MSGAHAEYAMMRYYRHLLCSQVLHYQLPADTSTEMSRIFHMYGYALYSVKGDVLRDGRKELMAEAATYGAKVRLLQHSYCIGRELLTDSYA